VIWTFSGLEMKNSSRYTRAKPEISCFFLTKRQHHSYDIVTNSTSHRGAQGTGANSNGRAENTTRTRNRRSSKESLKEAPASGDAPLTKDAGFLINRQENLTPFKNFSY